MDKETKTLLWTIGGLALLGWLLSRKHGKCPRCNYPVTSNNQQCPNCGQWLNWGKFK
ncbi:MAG: hypothetical protein QXR48_03820 [Candidatus Woesearchaeota archaeon]